MADYKKMYLTLVGQVATTIQDLQDALLRAENIYIETDNEVNPPIGPEKEKGCPCEPPGGPKRSH